MMMTVSEIAEQLHLSKPTVRKYLRASNVKYIVLPNKWLVPIESYIQLREHVMTVVNE